MKYYKMINNNTIEGVISSDNFIYYQPISDCFLQCDEQKGEYISYNGNRYRCAWMSPIKVQLPYIEITLLEITQDEYQIYYQAIENNEPIVIEEEEEEIIEEPDEPNISVEFIRSSKLAEMSRACRLTIEAGFDFNLRGETKHFSLTTQDQLNLMNLSIIAQTQQLIPYHADGEMCEFYTSDEINDIIAQATTFKNYQIAYHNALKSYINALETIEDIAAITYGTPIPDEYKSDVLKILEY